MSDFYDEFYTTAPTASLQGHIADSGGLWSQIGNSAIIINNVNGSGFASATSLFNFNGHLSGIFYNQYLFPDKFDLKVRFGMCTGYANNAQGDYILVGFGCITDVANSGLCLKATWGETGFGKLEIYQASLGSTSFALGTLMLSSTSFGGPVLSDTYAYDDITIKYRDGNITLFWGDYNCGSFTFALTTGGKLVLQAYNAQAAAKSYIEYIKVIDQSGIVTTSTPTIKILPWTSTHSGNVCVDTKTLSAGQNYLYRPDSFFNGSMMSPKYLELLADQYQGDVTITINNTVYPLSIGRRIIIDNYNGQDFIVSGTVDGNVSITIREQKPPNDYSIDRDNVTITSYSYSDTYKSNGNKGYIFIDENNPHGRIIVPRLLIGSSPKPRKYLYILNNTSATIQIGFNQDIQLYTIAAGGSVTFSANVPSGTVWITSAVPVGANMATVQIEERY